MNVVHAERITAPHETQEVIRIAAVVAVIKRYPSGTDAFILEDHGNALGSAIGCVSMNANWYASPVAGTNSRPQTNFFKGCHDVFYDPYLDDARSDAGPVDALLNFFFEEVH